MAAKKREMIVKVGIFPLNIVFDSTALALRDRDRSDSVYGETVYDTQQIFIRDDMASEFEKDTVFHEVDHFVNHMLNITDDTLKIYDEETIVRLKTPVWLQILRENPEFVEYLCL